MRCVAPLASQCLRDYAQRAALLLGLVAVSMTAAALAGCGGAKPVVQAEDPASWRHRGLWLESSGDTTLVMVVGRAENAAMGESFVMASAEQDARARLTLYLQATVSAYRERLGRAMAVRGQAADSDQAEGSFSTSEELRQGDRSIADNVIGGMETINSFTDKENDRFYVLGRVDMQALKSVLDQSASLTEAQKAFVAENAEVVADAWADAVEAGRVRARSQDSGQ